MKKSIIPVIAIIVTIFLFTSCQKAKESEGKKEAIQQTQKEALKQPSAISPEIQTKQETSIEIKDSPLTEEEQKEFEKFGGDWMSPNVFKNEKQAIKILKILVKGDHMTIRWFQTPPPTSEEEQQRIKKIYSDDIATALSVINPKTNREGFNLAIEILKKKKDYPEAMVAAAIVLKVAQDKSEIPLLREVAKHPNPTVRLQAAGALIMLGDADTALPILNELAEKEGLSGALYLLFTGPGKITDERGYSIVEKALKYPGAEVRISAVKLLLESKKITKEKAEEIALGILKELKDKTLKDYGLMRDPKNIYAIVSIPASGIVDVEGVQQRHHSNSRACEYTISLLATLRSKKAIPILRSIEKSNTEDEAWYNCKDNNARDALHVIEGGKK